MTGVELGEMKEIGEMKGVVEAEWSRWMRDRGRETIMMGYEGVRGLDSCTCCHLFQSFIVQLPP